MSLIGRLLSFVWFFVRFGLFGMGAAGVFNGVKLYERAHLAPFGVLSAAHAVVWSTLAWLEWRGRKTLRLALFLAYAVSTSAFMAWLYDKPLALAFLFSTLLAGGLGRRYIGALSIRSLDALFSVEPGQAGIGHQSAAAQPSARPSVPWSAVVLEGNICSGKTTFAQRMRRTLGPESGFQVHFEKVLPELHRAFIKDPVRFGFALQTTMAERRTMLLQRVTEASQPAVALIDRSVVGDYAFAAWNYVVGSLSEEEFRTVYCNDFGSKPSLMLQRFVAGNQSRPVLLIYLCQPAVVCASRLASRTGDDQATSIEYLRGIAIMHSLALADVAYNTAGLVELRIHTDTAPTRLETVYANKQPPHRMPGDGTDPAHIAFRTDESLRRFQWLVQHLLGSNATFADLAVGNDADGRPLICEHRCYRQLVAALE